VLNYGPTHPASDREEDIVAAYMSDALVERMYLDPLAGRPYPQEVIDAHKLSMDMVEPGDKDIIAAPIDFLGLNNYTRDVAAKGRKLELDPAEGEDMERTEMGWEVYPEGIYEMLIRVTREYPFKALYITENGAAFADQVGPTGKVDDPKRVSFLKRYLAQAARAISDGAPLRGYFVWSLMDNFEWAYGYGKRFGIVYVDYETQARIPKTSARWYSQVIAENAISD
jgi:beta-glucosidase